MNVEKINALARFLRRMEVQRPDAFNMGAWGNDWLMDGENLVQSYDDETNLLQCETPMCIAGWAVYLDKSAWESFLSGHHTLKHWGRQTLGLDTDQMENLFLPTGYVDGVWALPSGVFPYAASPLEAARVLEHLARTGEVDWTKMREVSNG